MARCLSEKGYRVVVLTRGYGRRKKGETQVLTRSGLEGWNPLDCGDEPYLLARSLPNVPVAVDGNRYRAARFVEEKEGADVFLLDDGFQHLKLARDLDIVLVPEEDDLERMACLPRGPLREPRSALRDAELLVRMGMGAVDGGAGRFMEGQACPPARGDLPVQAARFVPEGLYSLDGRKRFLPEDLRGAKLFAFCGIARPRAFWRTLESMGLRVDTHRAFPDHHAYSEEDCDELLGVVSASDWAITTEKDAVKLTPYSWAVHRVLYLGMELKVEDEAGFWNRLEASGVLPRLRHGEGVQGA
jgi:tetraacyldisaccharide 4'-kinase